MPDDKVASVAGAVEGIVKTVPVYQDVVQPAARELGIALQNVAKTIHLALAPVTALVWGYDRIKDYLEGALLKRFRNVPADQVTTPPPNVAGPALEALRYAGHDPTLRELYANLLGTSMDATTARDAHPAYVEMIKQLTPDEARIIGLFTRKHSGFPVIHVRAIEPPDTGFRERLRNFSLLPYHVGCEHPELGGTYLDNICRLGLAAIRTGTYYEPPSLYEPLEQHPYVQATVAEIESTPGQKHRFERAGLTVSALGEQFYRACVKPSEVSEPK